MKDLKIKVLPSKQYNPIKLVVKKSKGSYYTMVYVEGLYLAVPCKSNSAKRAKIEAIEVVIGYLNKLKTNQKEK